MAQASNMVIESATRCAAICIVVSALMIASNVYAQPADNLFTITRSKNANTLRYDIRRQPNGVLDTAHPVDAYWLMFAENGRREELTWMEREWAYGFSVAEPAQLGFTLRLQAYKQRDIRVEKVGNSYRARLVIAGKNAILKRIYVRADDSGAIPKVAYLELQGLSEAGEPVVERIAGRR